MSTDAALLHAQERVDELRASADRLVYLADDEEDADEHDRLLAEAHALRERAERLDRFWKRRIH